jgi:hypothetical protein
MMNEDDHDVILVPSSQLLFMSSTNPSEKKNFNIDLNQSKTIMNIPLLKRRRVFLVIFGLPARKNDKYPDRYEVIPNYSSCFKCFQTYRLKDSTTSIVSEIIDVHKKFSKINSS